MTRKKIPGWVIRAFQEHLVLHGLTPSEAFKQTVVVPVVTTIRDGKGGSREAQPGERLPFSALICQRSANNIGVRPDTLKLLEERSEQHRREMRLKGEKLDRVLATQLEMLAQGVRPQLTETGEAQRDKSGKQKVERLPPAVHVQALGTASNWAARQNPAAQKVELAHSGSLEVASLTPEQLEAKREALIAKAAARVQG